MCAQVRLCASATGLHGGAATLSPESVRPAAAKAGTTTLERPADRERKVRTEAHQTTEEDRTIAQVHSRAHAISHARAPALLWRPPALLASGERASIMRLHETRPALHWCTGAQVHLRTIASVHGRDFAIVRFCNGHTRAATEMARAAISISQMVGRTSSDPAYRALTTGDHGAGGDTQSRFVCHLLDPSAGSGPSLRVIVDPA